MSAYFMHMYNVWLYNLLHHLQMHILSGGLSIITLLQTFSILGDEEMKLDFDHATKL